MCAPVTPPHPPPACCRTPGPGERADRPPRRDPPGPPPRPGVQRRARRAPAAPSSSRGHAAKRRSASATATGRPPRARLRILESARLAPADLAHGQGWYSGALRAERHDEPRCARAALEGPSRRSARRRRQPARWPPLTSSAPAASRGPTSTMLLGPAADGARARGCGGGALLVVDAGEPDGAWLLDAGLAIGALGARAVVGARQLGRARRGGPARRRMGPSIRPTRPRSPRWPIACGRLLRGRGGRAERPGRGRGRRQAAASVGSGK